MGQGSILIVLVLALVGSVLMLNARTTAADSEDILAVHHEDVFGREVAMVGLEHARRRLIANPDDWDTTATARQNLFGTPVVAYETGTYQVTVGAYRPGTIDSTTGTITTPDEIDLTVTGTFQERDYVLKATYAKGYTDIGIPPAYRKALAADQTLRFNGQPQVRHADPTQNADVHSNKNVDAQGSPRNFAVEGHATYVTSYDGNQDIYFQPNDASDGNAPTYQTEVQPISVIDIPGYAASPDITAMTNPPVTGSNPVGTYSFVGDQTINLEADGWQGSVTGKGTPADPFIWYVNGHMDVNGHLRFVRNNGDQAHITIYVNGNLIFSGSGSLSPTAATAPTSTETAQTVRTWIATNMPEGMSLSLNVKGNVAFNGTVALAASLYANGQVTFNGGGNATNLIGNVVTKSELTLNGSNTVYYTEVSESVLPPGATYEVPVGVYLVHYSEWPDRSF